VVKLADGIDRDHVFARLRADGIGVNVHYAPVHLHSFYRQRGYARGIAPVAELVNGQLLTLPLFPAMSNVDVQRVTASLNSAVESACS
jgi:perosamine synthetase